eukprot:TRINITY_DN7463_c0_g3_i3.p1 TRINITY_DN7463_c0_g3~~TRINITY_DN7463_c0_g3_i3.p1  ORF type:complete len:521 (-),score=77.83 TRINITY_DN7463_c0_g3_i3:504-2066(-)
MTRHGGATLCDAMVRRCDTSVSFHCRATTCSVFSVISLLVRRYPSVWCNMPRKSARSSTAADSMASGTANVQDAVRTTATRAKRARRPAVAADASDGKGLMSDQVSDQVSGSVAAVSVASSVPVSAAVTPAVSGVNAASSLLLSAPPIPASLSASRLLCVQVDGKEVFVDTATGATYVPSGSVAANAVGSAPSVFARGAVTQGGLPPAEPAVFQDYVVQAQQIADMSLKDSQKYDRCFGVFAEFCLRFRLSSLPAQPLTVSAFVAFLARRGLTPSTIRGYIAAIAFHHRRHDYGVPESPLLQLVLTGVARSHDALPQKAPQFTRQMLLDYIDRVDLGNWRDLRNVTMMSVAFTGLLRASEVAHKYQWPVLLWKHISFDHAERAVTMTLQRSKHRLGIVEHAIMKRDDRLDAYMCLLRWKSFCRASENDIVFPSKQNGRTALTTSAWCKVTKQASSLAGCYNPKYSGHSWRSGGTTDLLSRGISIAAIMAYGRWRSDSWLEYDRRSAAQVAAEVSRIASSS